MKIEIQTSEHKRNSSVVDVLGSQTKVNPFNLAFESDFFEFRLLLSVMIMSVIMLKN